MSKSKLFADDGWAVWIDGDDTTTFYLNEWIDPKHHCYVDVGIHIRGVLSAHALHVYIPFPVETDEVKDISLSLRDTKLLYAMLNNACIIDFRKNACTSEIAYNGKTVDLIHISAIGFSIEPIADGALLTFSLNEVRPYLDNDEAFLRFRLPHRSLDRMFQPLVDMKTIVTRVRDLITSPLVSERYGHSVRINEIRMLPSEIIHISALHRQKLKKAVVSIAVSADYEISDANCYRIRRLEDNIYQDYAPTGFDCSNAIIYQWNATRETHLNGHYNFYFNIFHNKISRSSMMIYMFLLLLFGACGNALWELIKLIFAHL